MQSTDYLTDAIGLFRRYKELADKAMAQADEAALFKTLGPESNSIAVIIKHIAGNMRSRWTDFLTSDGEKPDRHRDTEFELSDDDSGAALLQQWEEGWRIFLETVTALGPEDLERTVQIRGEPHTVMQAINRQLTHYPYHVGQIVFLARHYAGEDQWESLSVPKGKSEEFNKDFLSKQ